MSTIQFDIPDTPFERIISSDPPEDFTWNGLLTLSAPNKSVTGAGSISIAQHSLRGTVEYDDTEEWQKAAAAGVVEIGWSDDVAPGKIVGGSRVAEAKPIEGDDWIARRCIIDGQSGFMSGVLRFSIGEISMRGPAHGQDTAFVRLLWSGAHIEGPPHGTLRREGTRVSFKRDRVNGSFNQHAFAIRNVEHPQYSNERFVAAVIECGALRRLELDAIWLLASFLSGRRLHQSVMERYGEDGGLIERRFLSGVPSSIGSFAPFHSFVAPLRGEYLDVIGSGFLRMLRSGFPIEVIIHHLHNSNEGNPETDAQSLLLGIHTAIEAWNRWFGVKVLADDDIFEQMRDALLELIEPMMDNLGPDLGETVKNKLRSANNTSTGYRERDLFSTLQIKIGKAEKRALATRNKLLHDGYFLKRWNELSDEERQERIDTVKRLRNLVHHIILSLVGFTGRIVEATRYEGLDVTSAFSPLFIATHKADSEEIA